MFYDLIFVALQGLVGTFFSSAMQLPFMVIQLLLENLITPANT